MPTNQQRRDAERRRLRRQLEERRAREAARKRFTLIASIVGTIVIIVAVVVIVVVTTGGGGSTTAGGAGNGCAAPSGATASFEGVTVTGAQDLKHAPKITAKGTTVPTTLACQNLVIGTGKAATASSTVTVQYTGVVYKDGKQFDSSWSRGQPAQFSLAQVVKGFTQGIAGHGKIAPMHVGGRRVMILPASLAYGANPPSGSGIPANAALVFVVDLQKVS